MKTPEGKVKEGVRKVLRARGAYFFAPVQTGYGSPALDYLVCYKGMFIGIECKAPHVFSMTKRQVKTAREIGMANGIVWLINDPEELERLLARF